ncbi:MAG: hypothetical protein V2I25_05210 [Woeseiaceae bacterium]|nr:hypothetical protein [Woeseiaceae bacterium]
MSFREKSAWGLLLGIVLVSVFYFPAALRIVVDAPAGAPRVGPLIGISIAGVIALVLIEVIYHAFVAGLSGRSAADECDERDVLIDLKAERNGGYALGFGLVWLVGFIVTQSVVQAYAVPGAMEIAVYILLALTASEVAKLLSQLWYYRVGV